MLLQCSIDPFVVRNKNLTFFEMVYHRTCKLNLACTRYIIGSRPNNDIMTISTFLFNNILLSKLLNIYSIIFDDSAVAIIVTFIFYSVNINRVCYVIVVVFAPNFIAVKVRNIVTFVGTL